MVLKVAAGVFVGIMAAWLAFVWLGDAGRESRLKAMCDDRGGRVATVQDGIRTCIDPPRP